MSALTVNKRTETESGSDDEILKEEQVCTMFGIQPRTLRTWREELGLPFLKPGKTVLYLRSDILRWVTRHRKTVR